MLKTLSKQIAQGKRRQAGHSGCPGTIKEQQEGHQHDGLVSINEAEVTGSLCPAVEAGAERW